MKHLKGDPAQCPFAQMTSSFDKDQKPRSASSNKVDANASNDTAEEKKEQQQQQQSSALPLLSRVAQCDSSSCSSLDQQYQEDLVAMTQKCPVFQQTSQQASQNSKATSTSSFSCPFKDQATSSGGSATNGGENDQQDVMRETLLKIPASHYDMTEFVRVMEGFHQRIAAAKGGGTSSSGQLLPNISTCPVPQEIKGKISFREAMESRSLAAIMARLAEQNGTHKKAQQRRDRSDSLLSAGDDDDESSQSSSTTASHEDEAAVASVEADGLTSLPRVSSTQVKVKIVETDLSSQSLSTASKAAPSVPNKRASLSEHLKTGTAVSHQAAEDVHFVKNFIRGKIDRILYGKLVLALYHVYDALEQELDDHAPAHFHSCHFPDHLRRVPALLEDVDFWHGSGGSVAAPSPATQDYVDRIHYIAKTNPLLLLSHSYTRYLGDLSGGKILARVARRALHLSKNNNGNGNKCAVDGLAFYFFENIASDKLFKDQYRQALDDLHLDKEQITALVAEANVAFLLNMRIFEELDVAANLPGAAVRPLREALEYAEHHSAVTTNNELQPEECPFLVNKKGTPAISTVHGEKKHTGGRCPWPFVVFHDPVQFLCDRQTMVLVVLIGLVLIWQK